MIDETLKRFVENEDALRRLSAQLNAILTKEKVRGSSANSFSSDALNRFVEAKSSELAAAMNVIAIDELKRLSENPVVFCKIILSFYRRANELHTFYAEGRVQ